MAVNKQCFTYSVKHFTFVTLFGSHNSPIGYVLRFTDEETQAFKKVNVFCSNAVNNFAERIMFLSLLGTDCTL